MSHPPQPAQQMTFASLLEKMEKQGELSGIEKNRLLDLYREGDERLIGIWECYEFDHDFTEFTESIVLFSSAISINSKTSRHFGRKKSFKKQKSEEGFPGIIAPQAMSAESEEYEEEEEEEEEENAEDDGYWNANNQGANQNYPMQEGMFNVNDDQVKNTFIEQQHRIIRRFCLNAKIPIADGAKFHQMINECNQKIISSFEVFALNRNEDDFLENLIIIADLTKKPYDVESPEGKNASSYGGFSPPYANKEEEEEKKLFDLEPMSKDNESEDEEEIEENNAPLQNGHANSPYSHAEIENYILLLEEFRDVLSEDDIKTLSKLIQGYYLSAVAAMESYMQDKDKEDTVETLQTLLSLIKQQQQ